MAIPSNRTPVRVARGAAVKFTETIDGVAGAGAKALEDGEIVWDETNEKFQIKVGGSNSTTLKDHTVTGMAALTGAIFTGDVVLDNQKELRLSEPDSAGSNYVGFKAPSTITNDVVWALPDAEGPQDALLKTNGSGQLGWSTISLSGYALKAGDTFTGDIVLDNGKKLTLSEADANGTNYLSFKAPDLVTANVDFQLPDGDGTQDTQPLITNSSGVLRWGTALSTYAPLDAPALTGNATGVNLTLSGNLTVNGTTTTIDTTNLIVDDPLMMLARNNSAADTVDIGFYGQYHLSGAGVYGGLFRDANDSGKWKLFANLSQTNIPDTTINTSDSGYTAATLVVDTLEDSKGDVRTIPQTSKTASYKPTDRSDVGKHIYTDSAVEIADAAGGGTTWVIGDAITIVNKDASANVVITFTNITAYIAGDATAKSTITVAARGVGTILFTTATECFASGAGLS